MDLTPAQTWLLAALPATGAEILSESRIAAKHHLCVGLPRTVDELSRMLEELEKLGHCKRDSFIWIRATPKPKKEARLFE